MRPLQSFYDAARQAEILGKLEELEAAKKQAGAIQTSAQLQEFMRTVGRLERELEALEQGRLSDRLDSETLGRLAEAVQNGQAELTATGAGDKIEAIAEPHIETLNTINMKLEGTQHPVTGVPFKRFRFELDGKIVEAVGPEFETPYTVHLPKEQYFASDKVQFKTCSLELYEAAMKDPQLREIFSEKQINDLKKGKTPRGYTWHHNVVTGEMQLVDYETHRNTPHTGGRNIWGGGTKYR